jgi:hypothetical protein
MDDISHSVLVPFVLAKEFLKGADGNARVKGDGLDILALEIGELSADILIKVSPSVLSRETLLELFKILLQIDFQTENRSGIHAEPSPHRISATESKRVATKGSFVKTALGRKTELAL